MVDDLFKYDVIVRTDEELEHLAKMMNCRDSQFETVAQKFHFLSGRELHDNRPNSEYSGVNAQADVEFYEEEPIQDINRSICNM